jgi:hypothetical protein
VVGEVAGGGGLSAVAAGTTVTPRVRVGDSVSLLHDGLACRHPGVLVRAGAPDACRRPPAGGRAERGLAGPPRALFCIAKSSVE